MHDVFLSQIKTHDSWKNKLAPVKTSDWVFTIKQINDDEKIDINNKPV